VPAKPRPAEHNKSRGSRVSPRATVKVSAPRTTRRKTSAPPDGVTFRHDTDAHGRTTAKFFKNGAEVGSADIRNFGHTIQITNFQIVRGARRQGIGTAFQSYIEAKLGKPAVPDAMLSNAEYRRWKKIDPIAVSDYAKGAKTYTPRAKSDGYIAAHGGRPVPGSRAAQRIAAQAKKAAAKTRRKPAGTAKKSARKPRAKTR
jgi:hypothetical protein